MTKKGGNRGAIDGEFPDRQRREPVDIDDDVVSWFAGDSDGYHARMNQVGAPMWRRNRDGLQRTVAPRIATLRASLPRQPVPSTINQ